RGRPSCPTRRSSDLTQSFLGVILAHFLYRSDRMTPAKAAGCAIGFAGVLVATIGNHGGGSGWGIFCMMAATVIFTVSGPWNKSRSEEHTSELQSRFD